MRNKIYAVAITSIFVFLMIWCPMSFALDRLGVFVIEDNANYKDPEKWYFFDEETRSARVGAYVWNPDNSDFVGADSGIPFSTRLYMNILNGIERGKANLLNDIAKERGQSLAQMALVWVLRKGRITSALIGASKPSQVEENVAALQNLDFTDEELARIDGILNNEK